MYEVVDTDVVLLCLCLLLVKESRWIWWRAVQQWLLPAVDSLLHHLLALWRRQVKASVDCWLDMAGVINICFIFHINYVQRIQFSFVRSHLLYFTWYEVLEDLAMLELSKVVDCDICFSMDMIILTLTHTEYGTASCTCDVSVNAIHPIIICKQECLTTILFCLLITLLCRT